MAKQNFLAGGYYGKLGQTVGQRWKNIRTIRTYVIPHNPRTPTQQANRGKFSEAVPYAQLGQQTNFGSILFKNEAKPEWSLRMQAAIANINARLSDVGIVPTYPRDFVAQYTITEADISAVQAGVGFTMTVGGNLPVGARSYSCILYLSNASQEYKYLVCSGLSSAEHPEKIQFVNPNTSRLPLSPITGKIISTDDETLETVVASGKLQVSYMGTLGWSWIGASVALDSLTEDGTFVIRLEKDGLGDGTHTGTVTGAFTEGTIQVHFTDGTSVSRMASICEFVDEETEHYNSTNALVITMEVPSSIIAGKTVERLLVDIAGLTLTFTGYGQNGYDGTITGSNVFLVNGSITV